MSRVCRWWTRFPKCFGQPTQKQTALQLVKKFSKFFNSKIALPRLLGFETLHSVHLNSILTFRHHSSYIYRTEGPLLPRVCFLYIHSSNILLIIFLHFLSASSFIPPQNVVYFLMLPFLVHKIFTLYINGVLNCKCPAPGPKG